MFDDFNFQDSDVAELNTHQQSNRDGQGNNNQNQQSQNAGQSNQGGNGGYSNNNQQRNTGGGNSGGYQQRSGGNAGGNNNWKGNGGGGGNFQKKEEVVEEPYCPIAVFIDRDFPEDIKAKLQAVVSKLINKGYTVRYNGDAIAMHNQISNLSRKLTEAYTPWKGFDEIESKHYWNTKTSEHMAMTNFPAWDKIPNVVKAMMSRNVRMLFGDKNNSIVKCLVTWSPDGASKSLEVTKDTGRPSFIIGLASKYNFPVINLGKEGAEQALERALGL